MGAEMSFGERTRRVGLHGKQVLAIMQDKDPAPMTFAELREACGRGLAYKGLHSLIKYGFVDEIRGGRGGYRLNDEGRML